MEGGGRAEEASDPGLPAAQLFLAEGKRSISGTGNNLPRGWWIVAEAATALSANTWRPARPTCLHPRGHRNSRSAGGVGQRVIRPQGSGSWVGSWASRGPKEAPQGPLCWERSSLASPPLPALFPGRVISTGCWSEFWVLPTPFRCSRFPGGSGVKNPSAMQETPGSGRSPAGGHGNPPQYSCLDSSMGRGAWWSPSLTLLLTRWAGGVVAGPSRARSHRCTGARGEMRPRRLCTISPAV